jgi:hypothetical protein
VSSPEFWPALLPVWLASSVPAPVPDAPPIDEPEPSSTVFSLAAPDPPFDGAPPDEPPPPDGEPEPPELAPVSADPPAAGVEVGDVVEPGTVFRHPGSMKSRLPSRSLSLPSVQVHNSEALRGTVGIVGVGPELPFQVVRIAVGIGIGGLSRRAP